MITITTMVCNRRCARLVRYYLSYLTLVSRCSGCCSQTRQTGVVTVWVHCACVRERSAAKGAHGVRARASCSARRKQSAGRRGTVVVALCNRFVSSSLFVFYPSFLSFDCYKPYIPSRLPDFWQVPYSFSLRKSLFGRTFFFYFYDGLPLRRHELQDAQGTVCWRGKCTFKMYMLAMFPLPRPTMTTAMYKRQ